MKNIVMGYSAYHNCILCIQTWTRFVWPCHVCAEHNGIHGTDAHNNAFEVEYGI